MLYRCESCQSVVVAPVCAVCHHSARPMTADETERYVAVGHAAFGDLRDVRDANGGVVAYEAR